MGTKTTGRTKSPATIIRVLAVVVAMLLVSAVTLQRSQSAFSGTTSYGDSGRLTSATVALSSVAASPLNIDNLVPGDTVVRCIDVKYDGTATGSQIGSIRLYGADASGGGLAAHLQVDAETGSAGATCASPGTWTGGPAGKLDTVLAAYSSYATGYDTMWTPAAKGETRAFRFTVTMPLSTTNAAQGKTATPVATWEVRSKDGTQR